AVRRLPRQVPSSRVNDIGIPGIDRDRLNVLDFRMILRGDALPGIASVTASKYAVQRADDECSGIRGSHGQRTDGFAFHWLDCFPCLAVINGTEERAAFTLNRPGSYVDHTCAARVEDNVVEHIIVALTDTSEAGPTGSGISGDVNLSSAGAQQNAVGILRVIREAANVATLRTDRLPLRGLREQCERKK